MNRTQLSAIIRRDWTTIVAESRCHPEIASMLPSGPLHVLGSSLKTEAGEAIGVLTAVAYCAPAMSSGRNACPMASNACVEGCLGEHAGRMGFDPGVKRAQLWKTALRFGAPGLFRELVRLDIRAHEKRAAALGMTAAVRLDGTSDFGDGIVLAPEFPGVVFYDYTKVHPRLDRARLVPHYHATLSFSGSNLDACLRHLASGGNVAVPFDYRKGAPIPDRWHGFPCCNGDTSDYRPGDPKGHVVALSWKGPKRTREAARVAGWLQ